MSNERKIHATFECFVKKGDRYLMLHRNLTKKIMPNVWMAPGGKREQGEGLFAAAHREVMEETGLKIKNLRIRATGVGWLKDIETEVFFHMLTADYENGEEIDSEDGELRWLTASEIKKLPNLLSEFKPEVVDHILGNDPGIISYRAVYDVGNHMVEFEIEEN